MSQAQHLRASLPTDAAAPTTPLRAEIERRRASGSTFSLQEAVRVLVPLCTEVAACHARGDRLFVHPSAICTGPRGGALVPKLAAAVPVLSRDRACLSPEQRDGSPGDARSSVFSIGAILYEMISGHLVSQTMKRPSEVVPSLDRAVETILAKALVSDRSHRPDDLAAFAQALHRFAPPKTPPPPAADESHLDRGDDFTVDVSLSMLPPDPNVSRSYPGMFHDPVAPGPLGDSATTHAVPTIDEEPSDPTQKLAFLKGRLEANPEPRYVVIKEGMDHGPFSAVELLQQIGSHTFLGTHQLRDNMRGEQRPIDEWAEFAPFAQQASLNRQIVAEKREIERDVVAEARGTRTKSLLGLGLVAILLLCSGAWFLKVRGARNDRIAMSEEQGINVETSGGIKGQTRKAAARGAGGVPSLGGGMSCEQARAKYVEEIAIGGGRGQADLTAGQFGVLNNGSYVAGCGAPGSMHVNVCAAVQNGRAVGVTVTTDPPNSTIAGCISGAVRRMSFPSNPKLDIATTRF